MSGYFGSIRDLQLATPGTRVAYARPTGVEVQPVIAWALANTEDLVPLVQFGDRFLPAFPVWKLLLPGDPVPTDIEAQNEYRLHGRHPEELDPDDEEDFA